MGKKSKRQPSGAAVQKPQAGAVINNRAVCRAVIDLWERTQGSASDSLQTLWQDYEIINSLTKVIKEKQGASPITLPDRRECLPQFEKWLTENGAKYDEMVEIAEFPDCGFGLRAKKDIKSEDRVLIIPDKLMMNSLTARDGLLGNLIGQDRILMMMHNVALSLHLLNEKYAGEKSFWKPYIDVLPHTFTTPFYFTKSELLHLQGSPTLVKSLQQIRNVAKLFSHLHRLIRTYGDSSLPLYRVGFYFQDFVWAVSNVMSRQNEIPLGISQGTTLALIPLWDFANHTEGHMTTFFDVENRMCECFAPLNTKAGDEFKIFYGPRNNSDLFVHQGFVYESNQSDYLPIKLGLSSGESSKTRALKERLITEAELSMPGTFKLLATGDPFSNELRFIVRVFVATHEQLQKYFNEKGELQGVTELLAPWHRTDVKTLDFLEKRCQLLLQAYKTTIDEDRSLVGGAKQLSPCSVLAVRLRLCEKKILYNAALFARTLRERLLSEPLPSQQQNGNDTPTTAEATTQPSDLVETAGTKSGALSLPEIVELDDKDNIEPTKKTTSGVGDSEGEREGESESEKAVKMNGNVEQSVERCEEEEGERDGCTKRSGALDERAEEKREDGEREADATAAKTKDEGRESEEATKTELEQEKSHSSGTE